MQLFSIIFQDGYKRARGLLRVEGLVLVLYMIFLGCVFVWRFVGSLSFSGFRFMLFIILLFGPRGRFWLESVAAVVWISVSRR